LELSASPPQWTIDPEPQKNLKWGRTGNTCRRRLPFCGLTAPGSLDRIGNPSTRLAPWSLRSATGSWIVPPSRSPNLGWDTHSSFPSRPPPRGSRFGSPLVLGRIHWVRPEMIVGVSYIEWIPSGLLRHVVHLGEREDTRQGATRGPGIAAPKSLIASRRVQDRCSWPVAPLRRWLR
jgi:hypothetical protein